ncbi:hypothetical protein GF339_01350, partial [candidate division KSB3 bacterium]|nr:hypothetical protein [candidate division KSB3 bacterium]MBD3323197.1 hypothetical protein [candidate division KSB3 bacterium]
MLFRRVTSQEGFSLIKTLLLLVVLAVIILYYLPTLGGDTFTVLNRISDRAKAVIDNLGTKLSVSKDKLAETLEKRWLKIKRTIEELIDKWNLDELSNLLSEPAGYKLTDQVLENLQKDGVPAETVRTLQPLQGQEFSTEEEFLTVVSEYIGEAQTTEHEELLTKHAMFTIKKRWEEDMTKLVGLSKSRGFDMEEVERRHDQYRAGEASWRRVETRYWEDLRQQTREAITTSIERFRTRQLGCSDFTVELRMIKEIIDQFNADTLEGYFNAKALSQELEQPRSAQFLAEVLQWLSVANVYAAPPGNDWSNDW